ncbi:hypothetical protein GA0061078_1358 [Bifidobacterium bohemicum]|uniref:DUF2530 domain-containing protein n=1 Tax=Bifidobacterium bohemicum DSM 22767 TaxID=1437606 RepID=A0A086ZGP9_9BIFI|nr:hypothetical protein [Bifidobacterium bohemicum]KFI45699.1 hypothetical protein BBOH_0500 [Bifidobacterium bohemicum DSM 22767]SCC07362.1 hypothetical protein GA0061078_1358 [Bifidobacterium bohemicum]
MKFAPIINPDVCKTPPKPVRVDLRKTFLIITSWWIVALVVLLILTTLGFHVGKGLILCGFGIFIGVLMLIWEHFDRADYRRLGAD